MSEPLLQLDRIQRWLQAVITHPEGPLAGVDSAEARDAIDVPADDVERVVARSHALTALERVEIYAGAYYARLIDCLRQEYSVLARMLGEEVFDAFALGYLQSYPSRSYTLNVLGSQFPTFLHETRPEGDASDEAWADLMIDVATLEWTIGEIFDGPGVEGKPLLDEDGLRAIPPERWGDARLLAVPCLRLLALAHPIKEYYGALRDGEDAAAPAAEPSYLALTRRNYVVRMHELSRPQFDLLRTLADGAPLGESLSAFLEQEQLDPATVLDEVRSWFLEWTAAGFFAAVCLDEPCA